MTEIYIGERSRSKEDPRNYKHLSTQFLKKRLSIDKLIKQMNLIIIAIYVGGFDFSSIIWSQNKQIIVQQFDIMEGKDTENDFLINNLM